MHEWESKVWDMMFQRGFITQQAKKKNAHRKPPAVPNWVLCRGLLYLKCQIHTNTSIFKSLYGQIHSQMQVYLCKYILTVNQITTGKKRETHSLL